MVSGADTLVQIAWSDSRQLSHTGEWMTFIFSPMLAVQ